MRRALCLVLLVFISALSAAGQALTVLHIRIVLIDAEQKTAPVPRHVLLVSDNPTTAPPRRIVTAPDGTVDVKLPPGNYTVESDRPVAFHGKAYQWTQMVDVVAGRDAVLELTAGNAEIESVTPAATAAGAAPLEADPSFLLPQWQDSVVAIWTPIAHASGFVVDAKGLIATNQRVIGSATVVEVQLSPAVKVAGRVIASEPARDVAVLWIDAKAAAAAPPVPLGCGQAAKPSIAAGQELFTISAPWHEPKSMDSGTVSGVEPRGIESDLRLASGSEGGPVFTAAGSVLGITSVEDDKDVRRRDAVRVVRVDAACAVVAAAETKMKAAAPPDGTHLPVEPVRPFPVSALKEAAQVRAGSQSPYQLSSSDFDVALITPTLLYSAQNKDRAGDPGRGARLSSVDAAASRALMDFGNWSEYVADFPPVLLIRVTPKLVEGFWTTVARGAARTQGVDLPPIKRFKTGFSRLRAFCGQAEVTPIHPFKLEQRVSESDAIYEGLYVFDPGALGPHCGTVKLELYSDKEPEKGDIRVVDPKVIQEIWRLFAPHREG
ncbi:MAG TPA: serine protease [Vicinamibacterales bacterium]|nr:serine protease [Vicinamibacterales bacterium]